MTSVCSVGFILWLNTAVMQHRAPILTTRPPLCERVSSAWEGRRISTHRPSESSTVFDTSVTISTMVPSKHSIASKMPYGTPVSVKQTPGITRSRREDTSVMHDGESSNRPETRSAYTTPLLSFSGCRAPSILALTLSYGYR